jgi:hypothetical protein
LSSTLSATGSWPRSGRGTLSSPLSATKQPVRVAGPTTLTLHRSAATYPENPFGLRL